MGARRRAAAFGHIEALLMVKPSLISGAAGIPSPALLAGEGEGEGTLLFGRGGAPDAKRHLANRNPHLNPLPRVVRERRVFHIAVVRRGVVRRGSRRPLPNQPLEATAGRC